MEHYILPALITGPNELYCIVKALPPSSIVVLSIKLAAIFTHAVPFHLSKSPLTAETIVTSAIASRESTVADATPAATAVVTKAVVATCVVLVNAAAVGAVGVPVSAGEERLAVPVCGYTCNNCTGRVFKFC